MLSQAHTWTGRLPALFLAGALGAACAAFAPAVAAPEYNPLHSYPLRLGPRANRLVVGFRAGATGAAGAAGADAAVIRHSAAHTSAFDVQSLARRTGVTLAKSRQLTEAMHVMFLPRTVYGADVAALLGTLRADPAVAFAEVDEWRHPHALPPNDPLFGPSSGATGQWYLMTPSTATAMSDAAATDAVSAWAITVGSSGTVIADIDTGVRFDHPDLLRAGFGGRLLPGYDFVDQDYDRDSGAALGTFLLANDGDGWDPDPSDPGDWISSADQANALFPSSDCDTEPSSWHGTRVSGILGAIADNGVGIAGMTWNPYLLPVRALGKCGGYDSDIITAMQWAAGLPVSGVADNPYPANIVNLSLGGADTCPSDYASVISTLTGRGVLIVASAGNASGAVEAPANCPGVLAVAGLRNVGTKVGYSSFGAEVGVSAPAGNCVQSSGACLRSIDTTVNAGSTVPGANTYTDQSTINVGTSFSAPIVAGVAALMRAVNANLSPAQLIARIESSASAFPQPAGVPVCPATASDGSGECACPNDGSQCGAGMVNALSAVQAALRPIAAVVIPTLSTAGANLLDAAGSAPSCGRTIVAYAWSATGNVQIQGSRTLPQASVAWNGGTGTVTLQVTDSMGASDVATVNFTSSGAVTTSPASAGTPAAACPTPLSVVPAAPTVIATFQPASVTVNATSTLAVTLANGNGFALTGSSFALTLPAGLTLATSPMSATTCGGAGLSMSASAGAIALSGANIPANGSCSVTVAVSSAGAANYSIPITADMLTTAPAGGNAAGSAAALTVAAPSHGGGGALDQRTLLLLAAALLAGHRRAKRSLHV